MAKETQREGNLEAPTRHPLDWKGAAFYDEGKAFEELERVFDNLVLNAIQYNHETGTVAITARVHSDTREWVADEVRIDVRNSGARIPEEERERVFERFYRLDPSRSRRTGGSGLGLALSREIVRLFKGTIRVGDSAHDGTTIEVSLPGGLVAA